MRDARPGVTIVLVAGVSGSGKSTVGALLAGRLGWAFADGDSFHPAANVAKMAAGTPLTDDDRWPWLDAIGAWMDERDAAGEIGVVACSALKRAYRAVLLDGRPAARMVFLTVSHDLDRTRLAGRAWAFFPRSSRIRSSATWNCRPQPKTRWSYRPMARRRNWWPRSSPACTSWPRPGANQAVAC